MGAFVLRLFLHVWSAKTRRPPNLSPTADNAVTQGCIWGLGSPLFICGHYTSQIEIISPFSPSPPSSWYTHFVCTCTKTLHTWLCASRSIPPILQSRVNPVIRAGKNVYFPWNWPIFQQLWCSSTKQGISRTGLFWDMDNWSWHRGEKLSICWFWDFCFFTYLDVFLSPPCNFWMIFKHFPRKKKKICIFCSLSNPKL